VKHFLNREMLAPNVATFGVDSQIVERFGDPESLPGNYSTISPVKWHSDIQWISAADEETFEIFQSAFDSLGIAAHAAPYLDLHEKVRLYAGFLVVRSRSSEADFHVDWVDTNNEAFTLLTPLTDNAVGFGLLYKRLDGTVGEYDYKLGEALILGDNFVHSTKPGTSDAPVVLLSFTFGTDKMVHWDRIFRTAGHQSRLVRQPDGKLIARK